jgi:hypothetical protein
VALNPAARSRQLVEREPRLRRPSSLEEFDLHARSIEDPWGPTTTSGRPQEPRLTVTLLDRTRQNVGVRALVLVAAGAGSSSQRLSSRETGRSRRRRRRQRRRRSLKRPDEASGQSCTEYVPAVRVSTGVEWSSPFTQGYRPAIPPWSSSCASCQLRPHAHATSGHSMANPLATFANTRPNEVTKLRLASMMR